MVRAAQEQQGARVVVLDDDPTSVALLRRMLLAAGYVDVVVFVDALEALAHLVTWPSDVLLLDMHMPLPGLDVLRVLADRGDDVATVCLTGDTDRALRRQSLDLGAVDFVTKPFDQQEVLLRVRNLLSERSARRQLQYANADLELRVRARTADLEEARNEVLERLAQAAEFRDDATHEHTVRVGEHARAVAQVLDQDPEWVEMLGQVAPLHDLGKIGVPDAVLLKPSRLTPAEFEVVKRHTEIGSRLLRGGRSSLMRLAEEVARTHHERWDGRGYLGMVAQEIPLSGRVVAVADVFDALTHVRPYKQAWPGHEARAEILRGRGRHFDPDVVDAFIGLLDEGSL